MGFRLQGQGVGCRVWGLGLRGWGLRIMVQGLGTRDQDSGCKTCFMVQGSSDVDFRM